MMDVNNSQVGRLFAQEFTNSALTHQQSTKVDQLGEQAAQQQKTIDVTAAKVQESQTLEANTNELAARQEESAETERAI